MGCVGCALVGNLFLVLAVFYWLTSGNTPYAFWDYCCWVGFSVLL